MVCTALFLLAGCAPPAGERHPASALLSEAIGAAGGREALANIRLLQWTGEATVVAGDRTLVLGIDTVVAPLDRARSKSWLVEQGPASARTLEIAREGGWMVRNGERTALPAPMVAHERLQYATYALMLLVPLESPQARIERRPDVDGLRVLHARLPGAPDADLFFDAKGRLVRLEDVVPDPEGTGTIAQRFDFEGDVDCCGVHWPRSIRITQDGKPFFALRIATFSVQ